MSRKAKASVAVNPVEGPQVVDREEDQEPKDWEIEDAARTIQKAHEIKNDPKMMGHVHKHVKKQIKSLKSLKALASQKALEEQGEEKEEM